MKNIKGNHKLKIQKEGNNLSRKDALKRLGLTAFSAATMMILLNNPAKGQDGDSPALPPDW